MSEPFIGQIMIVGFNFAPRGWANCDGQLLPIAQNSALFSLLGTMYGGDGRTSFGLPDLRGRVAIHAGNGPGLTPRTQGQKAGQEQVALNVAQLPAHNHSLGASSTPGDSASPAGAVPAASGAAIAGYADSGSTTMDPTGSAGNGQSHENMPPWLALRFVIALVGIFPSMN